MNEKIGKFENSESKADKDIPGFNELSESERKFVTSIKNLSEMSEEEFLEQHPELVQSIEDRGRTYDFSDDIESENQRIDRFKKRFRLADREKGRHLATMWELVELKLLERMRGENEEVSNRLSDLVEKIANRFSESSLGGAVPGEWRSWVRMMQDSIDNVDIDRKLEVINKLLSFNHKFDRKVVDMSIPAIAHGGVKDLWRYTVPELLDGLPEASGKLPLRSWDNRRFRARQFFVMLEQLDTEKSNQ